MVPHFKCHGIGGVRRRVARSRLRRALQDFPARPTKGRRLGLLGHQVAAPSQDNLGMTCPLSEDGLCGLLVEIAAEVGEKRCSCKARTVSLAGMNIGWRGESGVACSPLPLLVGNSRVQWLFGYGVDSGN